MQRNIVKGIETSPKSHQRRRVDLSGQLVEALLAWRRTQRARWLKNGKDVPSWVFPSREGTSLEERNVRAPITYVSQQLGHADPSITLRVYAHYLPDASRKEVDLLDAQPDVTPAQPEPFSDDVAASELAELFEKDGEPHFRELEPARRVVAAG